MPLSFSHTAWFLFVNYYIFLFTSASGFRAHDTFLFLRF